MIVRADLPIGFLAAQIVHAAGESSPGALPLDTNAVVLSVPGEPELVALEAQLRARGLDVHAVREPDAPWNGALTCLALPPAPRSVHRKHLSALPLFARVRQ